MFVTRWNNVEIARSDVAILVENTLYMPPRSIHEGALTEGVGTSRCHWKGGDASYLDVTDGVSVNAGAAWSYRSTAAIARPIEGWFGFWKGVTTRWEGDGDGQPIVLDHATPAVAKVLGATDVEWRPTVTIAGLSDPFTGYRVKHPPVLVEVFAQSGADDRSGLIEDARRNARAVAAHNLANPDSAIGYVAVWGSANPSPLALTGLKKAMSAIDLLDPPEIVSI